MSARKRLLASFAVLAIACVISVACSITVLYRASLRQQYERLVEFVRFEARLIEAMSEHETVDHSISHAETVSSIVEQLSEAQKSHVGFGETGEFILGRLHGDKIQYVFRQRHQKPPVVSVEDRSRDVDRAMRLALEGETGTLTGTDYRGEQVLSAFTYLPSVKLGLVAKIEMKEIRAPYVGAAIIAGIILLFVAIGGVVLLHFINDPTIRSLELEIESRKRFEKELELSENRYRALVDNIDHCISLVDEDHNIVMVNQKYADVFLKKTSEFVGRKCYMEFENRGSACSDCPGIISLQTKEATEKIVEFNTPGMGRRVFRIQAFPLEETNNGKRLYIELVIDETEMLVMQNELRKNETRLRMLTSKLIGTMEDERLRVSRDLHDSIGQLLTSIRLHAEWMLSGKSGAAPKEDLREMISSIAKGSDELHRVIRGLRPQLLDKVGLKEALEDLIEETLLHYDIKVTIDIEPIASSMLEPEVSITVYRVFQEAVNNILKHSHASAAMLRLKCDHTMLSLEVSDNGRGIDERQLESDTNFGLQGMRERVWAVGGDFSISSQPGQGLKIRVNIPLDIREVLQA